MQGLKTRNKVMLNMRSSTLSSTENSSAFKMMGPPLTEICCSKKADSRKRFSQTWQIVIDFDLLACSRISGKDSSKPGKRKSVRVRDGSVDAGAVLADGPGVGRVCGHRGGRLPRLLHLLRPLQEVGRIQFCVFTS